METNIHQPNIAWSFLPKQIKTTHASTDSVLCDIACVYHDNHAPNHGSNLVTETELGILSRKSLTNPVSVKVDKMSTPVCVYYDWEDKRKGKDGYEVEDFFGSPDVWECCVP